MLPEKSVKLELNVSNFVIPTDSIYFHSIASIMPDSGFDFNPIQCLFSLRSKDKGERLKVKGSGKKDKGKRTKDRG